MEREIYIKYAKHRIKQLKQSVANPSDPDILLRDLLSLSKWKKDLSSILSA